MDTNARTNRPNVSVLPPERLIDIQYDELKLADLGTDHRLIAAIFVGLAIVLLAFIVMAPLPATLRWFYSAGYLVVVTALVALFGRRLRRWVSFTAESHEIDAQLSRIGTTDIGITAKQVLWTGRGAMNRVVKQLAHALIKNGKAPCVFRICTPREATTIRPIAMPFEPRPLDEAEDAFRSIESLATDTELARNSSKWESEQRHVSRHAVRRLKRNIVLAGGLSVMIVGAIQFATACVRWAVRPAYDWRLIASYFALPIAMLVVPMLVPRNLRFATTREWYLLNGGVVVRKMKRRANRWQLVLFRRDEAVLFVYRLPRKEWGISLGNKDGHEQIVATAREVDCLLRAWLSPLPPPTLDKLSDLQ